MASKQQHFLTTEERRARARVAIATRWHQQPAAEDLALLEVAKAERPMRRLAAAVLALTPEQRARLAELLDPDDDQERAHARTA